jgi:ankyrin repeat protein
LALDFFNDQRHIDFILGWYWRLVNGNPRVSSRGAKLLNIAGYFNILWLIDLALVLGDTIDEGSPLGKKASPLIWASEMGNLDAIVKLLDAGANPNHRDTDNWTALHWAAANGHHAVAHALMQAGADREWKDSNGLSPVDWAKRMGYPELASAIENFGVLMTLVAPQNQIYPPEIDTAMIPKCSTERQSALPCFRDYIKSTLENSDKT